MFENMPEGKQGTPGRPKNTKSHVWPKSGTRMDQSWIILSQMEVARQHTPKQEADWIRLDPIPSRMIQPEVLRKSTTLTCNIWIFGNIWIFRCSVAWCLPQRVYSSSTKMSMILRVSILLNCSRARIAAVNSSRVTWWDEKKKCRRERNMKKETFPFWSSSISAKVLDVMNSFEAWESNHDQHCLLSDPCLWLPLPKFDNHCFLTWESWC